MIITNKGIVRFLPIVLLITLIPMRLQGSEPTYKYDTIRLAKNEYRLIVYRQSSCLLAIELHRMDFQQRNCNEDVNFQLMRNDWVASWQTSQSTENNALAAERDDVVEEIMSEGPYLRFNYPEISDRMKTKLRKCFSRKEKSVLSRDSVNIAFTPRLSGEGRIIGFPLISIWSSGLYPPVKLTRMKWIERTMRFLEKEISVDEKGLALMKRYNIRFWDSHQLIDVSVKNEGDIELSYDEIP